MSSGKKIGEEATTINPAIIISLLLPVAEGRGGEREGGMPGKEIGGGAAA